MAILVTGGAGYIGSHTVIELDKAGFDVVIVDNFSNSSPEVLNRLKTITGKDFPLYEGDILDRDFLVTVFEKDSFKNRRKNASEIGVMFGQKSHLWWDLPLLDSFKFLQKIYSKTSVEDDKWLEWLINELEVKAYINQPVRELSLGQRMRGEFVCALLHSPKLVILDEPTIGIDVQTKQKMMEIILKVNEQKNMTFMITSHDFQEIEKVCQRIIILNKGINAYQGSIEEFKNQYSYLKKVIIYHEQGQHELIENSTIKVLAKNIFSTEYFFDTREISEELAIEFIQNNYHPDNLEVVHLSLSELMTVKRVLE